MICVEWSQTVSLGLTHLFYPDYRLTKIVRVLQGVSKVWKRCSFKISTKGLQCKSSKFTSVARGLTVVAMVVMVT